jgi:hypothetical protein
MWDGRRRARHEPQVWFCVTFVFVPLTIYQSCVQQRELANTLSVSLLTTFWQKISLVCFCSKKTPRSRGTLLSSGGRDLYSNRSSPTRVMGGVILPDTSGKASTSTFSHSSYFEHLRFRTSFLLLFVEWLNCLLYYVSLAGSCFVWSSY